MSMYVNRKKIKPFTLMEFEEQEEVKETDPTLDAIEVEEQP